ncbi:hypothetical protein FRC07_007912 [Ceratobasidium sp. 392]|nr:hypothetical protein FRC07_007912 [Ceratobasidium sp. 392]
MSATFLRDRPNDEPASPTRKTARKTPRQRYESLVCQLEEHLKGSVYRHPATQKLARPLQELTRFLKKRVPKFDEDQPYTNKYLAQLRDIVDHIGSSKGVFGVALFQKDGSTVPTSDPDDWPTTLRAYWPPMVKFKHKLLTSNIKARWKMAKSEIKTLRAQVRFLVATRQIVMNKDLLSIGPEQLRALVNTNWANPAEPPKYPLPSDGSGTPQIPGLFPSGPVSVKDMEKHDFCYVTGGTTCGVINTPVSPAGLDKTPLLVYIYHNLSE